MSNPVRTYMIVEQMARKLESIEPDAFGSGGTAFRAEMRALILEALIRLREATPEIADYEAGRAAAPDEPTVQPDPEGLGDPVLKAMVTSARRAAGLLASQVRGTTEKVDATHARIMKRSAERFAR